MSKFKLTTLAVCFSSLLFSVQAKTDRAFSLDQNTKPNIVYIILDDQRYDAFGFLNKNISTPHMDSIAEQGTYFKNAFVTTSLSSPSRASILTGMYAHNHGVSDNNPTDLSNLKYFPEYLKGAGYQTGFFGKWHFGGADKTAKNGFAGFDHWVGLIGQGDYYPINIFGEQAVLNIDGQLVPQKGYITDELTDYAVNWLNQVDKNEPFMLYLSHKGVHADFYPAVRHKGSLADIAFPIPSTYENTQENNKGKPMWVQNQRNSWHGIDFPYNKDLDIQEFQRDYYETLASVDDSVGRVQAWLKDNGLDKNTIIMVMGDNGFMIGEHGLIDKRNAYEESIRIPLIASGPGFAKGITVDDIVANIDIAPTLLDAAHIKAPSHFDGQSFLGVGTDRQDLPKQRDHIAYEYFWEYSFPQTPTTFAIRTPEYKYIQYYGVWDKEELYDMNNDREETTNLIDSTAPHLIETKIALRQLLFNELRNHQGKNVIPYNMKDSQGMVLRVGPDAEKLAPFPIEWTRSEMNPKDKWAGVIPDQVEKEAVTNQIFESFIKADELVKKLMAEKNANIVE